MSSRTKVCVLGSTGTIGTYTLDLVRSFPEKFQVVSLAAGKNLAKLREQITEFRPAHVSLQNAEDAQQIQREFPNITVGYGLEGVKHCVDTSGVEVVVVGIVGFAGLEPTLHAIRAGKKVGLANKEALVTAGSLLQEEIKKSSACVVPVDSEHNALFQLLGGVPNQDVETLVLTASGGPFLKKPDLDLSTVTPEMATAHPNWKMGPKISVDSATLLNKGLELIEAHFLFGFAEHQIEVWIHPQSIVHGAIWLKDHTSLAQLSVPDMKSAIGYALSYPERLIHPIKKLSFAEMARLEFFEPDVNRFPCLNLARKALQMGQSHVIALNAANEVAVEAFLSKEIRFTQIPQLIESTLTAFSGQSIKALGDVFSTDEQSRSLTRKILNAKFSN